MPHSPASSFWDHQSGQLNLARAQFFTKINRKTMHQARQGDADVSGVPTEPAPKRPRVVVVVEQNHNQGDLNGADGRAGGGGAGDGDGDGDGDGGDAVTSTDDDAAREAKKATTTTAAASSGSNNDDDESCTVHSIHRHDTEVRATISDAVAYLDTLASQAEDSKREVTVEIEQSFDELQSFLQREVARNVAMLKAEAQRNMTSSLAQLKTLNTADFKGKQRLLYPKVRVRKVFETAFGAVSRYIFLVQGTHIVDLPIPVLVHILQYLNPTSLIAVRAVCFQFWKAVCEVTRTDSIALSTDVQRKQKHDGGKYRWKLVDGDTLETPTGDFQFQVSSPEETICLRICLAAKRLFAQPKHFKVVIATAAEGDNNNEEEVLESNYFELTTEYLYSMETDCDRILNLHCLPPSCGRFHITITAQDSFSFPLDPSL
ncbi:hypothetical protein Pelo_18650 [Pelomyxa schiedti]|nr:hypothetical protein Pelo_18650 [Pelomyxa schiedti]